MSMHTLVSLLVGVPLCVLALALLFRVETNRLIGWRTQRVVDVSAVVSTILLVVLIVARFVTFS